VAAAMTPAARQLIQRSCLARPDDFDWLFRGLDVGVAGLTLVLSAAYYATCYSCRTHPDRAGYHVPQVIMAAESQRVRVLAG
jgi:hypothetical protein